MGDHAGMKGIQRAELARRTGCNLETVRYYEKVGLLPEPPRTASGWTGAPSARAIAPPWICVNGKEPPTLTRWPLA